MKQIILATLLSNFILCNTLYTSNTYSGISTKKGKAAARKHAAKTGKKVRRKKY